jgi:L-ribulose-5-phosphate 4-epimerase
MTLADLKKSVCAANLELVAKGLVVETWGNASAIDRVSGRMVIKPSVEGRFQPSSDTPTHLALYRAFPGIGGVVHTHSVMATAWAQSRRPLPALGTTHADYFYGPVPCTRALQSREIEQDYEANTGAVMVEALAGRDPLECPGVLVDRHGPFTWGRTVEAAVENAGVLEHLALLASATLRIAPESSPMPAPLLDKHFFRKHGPGAYYGQKTNPGKRAKS